MTTYYFLDTNIIISYIKNESIAMKNFIDDPHNIFYYTDEVRIVYGY